MLIDLRDKDKAAVLAALFNASQPLGLGFLHYDPQPMSVETARNLLKSQTYFDYLQGRVMKISLSGDTLDTGLYDRDNGAGAAERALKSLEHTQDVNSYYIERMHKEHTAEAAEDVKSKISEKTTVDGNVVHLGLGDFEAELNAALGCLKGEE